MEKKGAMELSVGTIVVIVLSMSMLILGLILIRGLFSGATDVTQITTDQIKDRIIDQFGEDKKLAMYPLNREIEAAPGEEAAFGFGIKNSVRGSSTDTFSYEVTVSDVGNCGVAESEALSWISLGKSESNLQIASGEVYAAKVSLFIPEGAPLCEVRYRVTAMYGSQAYAADLMDVYIRA